MQTLTELKHDIAASLYIIPCTLDELMERDFLKNRSEYGVEILLSSLHKDGALYYRGDKMFIKKDFVRKKLQEYELL